MIEKQGDTMSERIGRITVVYIESRGVVRVVETANGRCIKEDPVGVMTPAEFRATANRYRKMMEL